MRLSNIYKKVNNYQGLFLSFIAMLVIQTASSISISPLFEYEGMDSAIFRQMGLALFEHKFIYSDLFDHKGPLLFFINAFGCYGSGKWDIFLLQVLNYTCVLYLWAKTAELFSHGKRMWLPVLMTMLFYFVFNEEGNLSEDWCMMPISYSMYLLARMLTQDKLPNYRDSALLGFGMGCVAMIRMNNMPISVILILFCAYHLVRKKQWHRLIFSAAIVAVGFFVVILLCLAFFYLKWGCEGINKVWFATFTFNFKYMNGFHDKGNPLPAKIIYFVSVLLMFVVSRQMLRKNKELLLAMLLLYMSSYVVMGANMYLHYFLITLPIICCSLAMACPFWDKITSGLLVCLLTGLMVKGKLNYDTMVYNGKYIPADYYHVTDKMIGLIPENERNDIFNYNDYFSQLGIFSRHRIVQCNMQVIGFHSKLSETLRKRNAEQLRQKHKWIICAEKYQSHEDSMFVHSNYTLMAKTKFPRVEDYSACNGQVYLYRLNR